MFAHKTFQIGISALAAFAALAMASPKLAQAAGCPAGTLYVGSSNGHPLCSYSAFKKSAAQQKGGGSGNQPTPGEKPYMEFSTKPGGTTAPGAGKGGQLDEAVAKPANKRNGLTIPSKTAQQPKVVAPAATARQKALMEQLQQRLKAQNEAEEEESRRTKSHGLTIPSRTAQQPKVVAPAATAEQKALMEQVQQRLKAREAAEEKKKQAAKSHGLTIPSSKTVQQPKVVMPAATAEQKRLLEQAQQRLKGTGSRGKEAGHQIARPDDPVQDGAAAEGRDAGGDGRAKAADGAGSSSG